MIVGSDVYFFCTDSGRGAWVDDTTIVYPLHLELIEGKIVEMNEDKDYVHVYVKGTTTVLVFGYCFHEDYFFESKEKAIEVMTNKLMNL